jgi:hypothetical protein
MNLMGRLSAANGVLRPCAEAQLRLPALTLNGLSSYLHRSHNRGPSEQHHLADRAGWTGISWAMQGRTDPGDTHRAQDRHISMRPA